MLHIYLNVCGSPISDLARMPSAGDRAALSWPGSGGASGDWLALEAGQAVGSRDAVATSRLDALYSLQPGLWVVESHDFFHSFFKAS